MGQGLILNGGTSELTAGRIASRGDGSGGTIRCAPAGDTGECSIAFYRNGNGAIGATGDQWVMGQGSWGSGDRGFGLGCNNTGLCLSISSGGIVTFPKGINATSIAWVSCRINADLSRTNNRGVHLPSVSNPISGKYDLTFPAHPSGANYVPQCNLFESYGQLMLDSQGATGITVRTIDVSSKNVPFYITIL